MASPAVQTTAEGAVTTASTTHTITFPSGSSSGDLIVVFFAFAVESPTAWSDGFTTLDTLDNEVIVYKQIDGSEGGNVSPTIGNTKSSWIVYRISGHANPATQAPEYVATGQNTTTPNPLLLTPTGGTKDYLFIQALVYIAAEEADDDTWANSAPSGYSGLLQKTSGTGGAATTNSYVATAHRAATVSSEDAGTWSVDVANPVAIYSVVIHPAAAATFGPPPARNDKLWTPHIDPDPWNANGGWY